MKNYEWLLNMTEAELQAFVWNQLHTDRPIKDFQSWLKDERLIKVSSSKDVL